MERSQTQLDSWSCNSRYLLARNGPEDPGRGLHSVLQRKAKNPRDLCQSALGVKNSFLTPELVITCTLSM